MKSVLRNSIFIFLLFLSIESQSQTPDIKFNLIAGSNGVSLGPGGLFLYNRKEDDFYIFGEENTSIAIQNIGSVIADDENNLWMSSSSGIYRLNKDRNQVVLFGKESGVNPEELRFSWITKMSDGNIFIPGYYGYYSFDPRKIKINSVPP